MSVREFAKKLFLTGNTTRYLVESPRLLDALRLVGPVGTLLDAGAGGGHYSLHHYLPICRRLVAIEYDDRNFQILRRSLAPYQNKAEVIQGSLTQIPLPDGSVDCIACSQVLEHIKEDGTVADEFTRVLTPDGYLLVTVPQPPAPWPESDHVREGYRHADLDALFLPRGFERVHTDWFLTRDTQRVYRWIARCRGYFPRVFSFPETKATPEQRRDQGAYGVLALYRKHGAGSRNAVGP